VGAACASRTTSRARHRLPLAARAEAEKAFKDSTVYLEKYIEKPRHVEIQIIGDQHGNLVHLGERDCSLQRRHQKLVEESPCPVLDEDCARRWANARCGLAKAANYHNAGTVEFLLDKDKNFYFIEINSRIQVEHPVTEMVTGVDASRANDGRRDRRCAQGSSTRQTARKPTVGSNPRTLFQLFSRLPPTPVTFRLRMGRKWGDLGSPFGVLRGSCPLRRSCRHGQRRSPDVVGHVSALAAGP
jgi:hypothetical protein